jgi:hypothetical protein
MDGNESLKRILTRAQDKEGGNAGSSIELKDTRTCGEDYFLAREGVDAFGKEMEALDAKVKKDAAGTKVNHMSFVAIHH